MGFENWTRRSNGASRPRDKGEIPADADPDTLAGLASAVHATLGVRARAGIPRAELEEFARKSVESICRNP